MKKIVFIIAVLMTYQYWDSIISTINPAPDYAAQHSGMVILYATTWCGYCKKTRKLLNDNNIEYFEYDIEKSSEGHKQFRNLGGRGVPLLLINGQVIKGYDPIKTLELISKQ